MKEIQALYRLPYADHYTHIVSNEEPLMFNDIGAVGTVSGFLFVPFASDEEHPVMLIRPTSVEQVAVPVVASPTPLAKDERTARTSFKSRMEAATEPSKSYTEDYNTFHTAITNGQFAKLVLARSCDKPHSTEASPIELFHRACHLYPRAMVMLITTPVTGTWLIATPEILLDSEGDHYRTMALAGTMPYSTGVLPSWSAKNQHEQHIVEQYIDNTLQPFSYDIIKDGPHTVRAGNLQHLCTTFRFHLKQCTPLCHLLSALHPTPAVCGLPKAEARRFINSNEHCHRSYYSGFAGPIGMTDGTHLYVTLRCMQIHSDHCTLFAGGGIMPDSTLDSEWNETENKLQTMTKVFR